VSSLAPSPGSVAGPQPARRKTASQRAKPSSDASTRTIRAHSTRDRILDAAEELFATRGYHGVSIRDITEAAGVQLALANYHFGSKSRLYGQVVERRGKAHAAQMQKYLDDVLAEARGGRPDPERIIWAFCASIFERLINGGPGWRRYIRLLALTAESQQREAYVKPMNKLLDPVRKAYLRALRQSYPDAAPVDLHAAFYFMESGLVYTNAATGGVDRVSRGALRSTDFKRLLPRLVRYATAGFDSLAAGPPTSE
jgi:AcrR family transcriptional regulator